MRESVLSFDCEGDSLLGILAEPDGTAALTALLIIVGGPQYRAGSHRQFTLLARELAQRGFVSLRFDYRGMGDSAGDARDFRDTQADIGAALDALLKARPNVRQVMLWGLCDGASAALMYLDSTADPRVGGITLLNPWVRSTATAARAEVKHYYLRKLTQPAFWRKLLGGGVALKGLQEFLAKLLTARSKDTGPDFVGRMARGWRARHLPCTVILSGDDLVAREFSDRVAQDARWRGALQQPGVALHELADADHTFSSLPQQAKVAEISLVALQQLDAQRPDSYGRADDNQVR